MAWEPVSNGEKVSYGLVPPGPLAPALGPSGEKNVAKLRSAIANDTPVINPYAGPLVQGADDPGKLGRILGIANKVSREGNPGNERLGPIPLQPMSDQTKIAMVTPPGAGSLMGRIGLAGAAQGAGALARGEGAETAAKDVLKGAAGQATGEAIGAGVKGVRALLPAGSGTLAKYTADREAAMLNELKQQVPGVANAKSLRDAFYSQATRDAVHQAYDDSLKAVIKAGQGVKIQVPEDAAEAFNLGGTGGFQFPAHLAQRMGGSPLAPGTPGMTTVDAAEAAKAITGAWKKNPAGYRAIADALDTAGIGDPAARGAYKTFIGYENFMDKIKGLKTGKLDLVGAQQGLNTPDADPLLSRGLADRAASVLMPTGKPIEQGTMRLPGAILGGLLGGAGLHNFGHAGGGALGGALAGSWLGAKVPRYTNIPMPVNPDVSMLLNQYLQGALQQNLSTTP